MNRDIRSWYTLFAATGSIFGLLTAVCAYFKQTTLLTICAAIGIICIAVAAICFYHKPKNALRPGMPDIKDPKKTPRVGVLDVKGFRFKGQ